MRGVSIGFRVLQDADRIRGRWRRPEILKCEIVELSLVTIPANTSRLDPHGQITLAATGPSPPRVTGCTCSWRATPHGNRSPNKSKLRSFARRESRAHDRIDGRRRRRANDARRGGQRRNTTRSTVDVETLDEHLVRLRAKSRNSNLAAATPIGATPSALAAADLRGGIMSVKANVPPGTPFIRHCQALAVTKGDAARSD